MTDRWSSTALAHPVLDSVRPYADRLASFRDWPTVEMLDASLRDRLALEPAVELEEQHKKPRRRRAPLDRDALYVVRIARHGRIPTRPRSWHDLTNALVWAAFPKAKRALTARQLMILDARVPLDATSLPNARSREEDALAMLDEGGIVIATGSDRVEAISASLRSGDPGVLRAPPELLATYVFGHALMEHAIAGRTEVRGYAVVLALDEWRSLSAVDAALSEWIERGEELSVPAPWRALRLDAAYSEPHAVVEHRGGESPRATTIDDDAHVRGPRP